MKDLITLARNKRPGNLLGEYPTYEDALLFCSGQGYEDLELTRMLVEKAKEFRSNLSRDPTLPLSSLRTLVGLGQAASTDTLRVLDFGGGGGYHYEIAKRFLGDERRLIWAVVETAALAKQAKTLENESLRFFESVEAAQHYLGEPDLVFTSGALHYTSNPLKHMSQLAHLEAKNMFVTRVALNMKSFTQFFVQKSLLSENGPGLLPIGFAERKVRYPVTFVPRHEFESVLLAKYEINIRITEDYGAYRKPGFTCNMYSYACKLRGAAKY